MTIHKIVWHLYHLGSLHSHYYTHKFLDKTRHEVHKIVKCINDWNILQVGNFACNELILFHETFFQRSSSTFIGIFTEQLFPANPWYQRNFRGILVNAIVGILFTLFSEAFSQLLSLIIISLIQIFRKDIFRYILESGR